MAASVFPSSPLASAKAVNLRRFSVSASSTSVDNPLLCTSFTALSIPCKSVSRYIFLAILGSVKLGSLAFLENLYCVFFTDNPVEIRIDFNDYLFDEFGLWAFLEI
ncbi:hypothetical protein HPP92_004331 [Vanilla planifolia]|uniref:Uncharacterized protein n=1 Tax=Vanilla planifolia TaxID=51239 RepID=A0A835RX54_VANPL|nr:hypothetical protein HPP92_004331 [Vanilla planifolia]